MRNAQPAAKESCLCDQVLTPTLTARSYSASSVEGSREVSRSHITMIALRNLAYQNVGRVSDATPFDCLIRCASGRGAGELPGLNHRNAARHRDHLTRCVPPVLEGLTQMQTTSMHTPLRRGGALLRTVRAVSRWFSQSANALTQPSANADGDRWFDWPRFPPF
jgi:hypothetical protein